MAVTLARWLDEHPAPAGLEITREAAAEDGPYRRGAAARVEIAALLPPLSGYGTVGTVYFTIGAIGMAVHLDPAAFAGLGLVAAAALLGRRRARKRRRPRIVLEGARATLGGPDGAHELVLDEVTACRVVDTAGRTKSLGHDHVVEVVTGRERLVAWRGPREQLAWIAELLAVAIAEVG